MKKSFKILGISLLLGCASFTSKAQVDPHFSMYYVYPTWMNPALTGVFDGDYRIAGIYRNQWGSISKPFSTPGIAADFSTNKNANFGINLMNQTAGDGGYNHTTAYGNAAYSGIRFGKMESKRVLIGLQFGMIQRGFNSDKLKTGDQYNVATGVADLQTQDPNILSIKKVSSFDMSVGAFYYDAMPGKKLNAFGGFSVSHLTKPKTSFTNNGNEVYPMRSTIHGGVRIAVNSNVSISPNFLYMMQGQATEKMLGATGQLKYNTTTDLMAGINYRFDDAIAPFIGFTYNNYMFGASYDINTSDLGKSVPGTNGFEFTLSYIGRKTTKTPEVEFVCPRL